MAAALAALSGHQHGSVSADVDGLVALCLEVTCADEEAAFWLCLALRARLAPADAAAVAVHAARRRPDLCCALGARGRGHTVDYLLYTGVWRSAPAMSALEAPLGRWLGSGFASTPDAMQTPQLLRAWDEALLGAAAPAETMARLAAARIAARADAAIAAASGAPAESDARGAAIAALLHQAANDDVMTMWRLMRCWLRRAPCSGRSRRRRHLMRRSSRRHATGTCVRACVPTKASCLGQHVTADAMVYESRARPFRCFCAWAALPGWRTSLGRQPRAGDNATNTA